MYVCFKSICTYSMTCVQRCSCSHHIHYLARQTNNTHTPESNEFSAITERRLFHIYSFRAIKIIRNNSLYKLPCIRHKSVENKMEDATTQFLIVRFNRSSFHPSDEKINHMTRDTNLIENIKRTSCQLFSVM